VQQQAEVISRRPVLGRRRGWSGWNATTRVDFETRGVLDGIDNGGPFAHY
jgi:hypothetical protein